MLIPKGWGVIDSPNSWGVSLPPASTGTSWVSTDAPRSALMVHYQESATSAVPLYTRQGNAEVPNLAGALRIPKCTVTSHTVVADSAVLYTCAPQGGLTVAGAVVIRPYPEGFRWVETRLPAGMAVMAQQIAGSLTTPPLVPGPYGFDVPKGWSVSPLRNSGGSGSFATVTDPQHRVKISYEAAGGMASVVNRDGSLNLHWALVFAGCGVSDHVLTVAGPPATPSLRQSPPSRMTEVNVKPRGLIYQCQPTSKPGQLTGAMLLPENYWSVRWWKLVTVSGPPDQLALAVKVVESLHWSSP